MSQPEVQVERNKMLTREQVTTAITALMEKVSTQTNSTYEKVVHELFDLATQIDALYQDISSVEPQEIKAQQIKSAHDELSAIVESTQGATFQIIGEAEKLEKIGKTLPPEAQAAMTESVTRIYEACGFQDITGQRIKKVVSTLRMIENRVDGLITALGGVPPSVAREEAAAAQQTINIDDDASLMHGPSLPGQAISQEEIDKLLGF
jgi:chemotaxis protein CheZ